MKTQPLTAKQLKQLPVSADGRYILPGATLHMLCTKDGGRSWFVKDKTCGEIGTNHTVVFWPFGFGIVAARPGGPADNRLYLSKRAAVAEMGRRNRGALDRKGE